MIADLTGKTALITGAANGLGKGIASILAQQGASIVVADIDFKEAQFVVDEIVSAGSKAVSVKMDVTDVDSVDKAISKIINTIGPIHKLVNNAGVIGAPGWHERLEVTEEDWDFTYDVNVKGTVHVTERLHDNMIQQREGSIVNIASVAGKMGNPDRPNYNASKAAVISYTKSAALKLAKFNINVNCICPGNIWTPMWDKISMRQFNYGSGIFSEFPEVKDNRELFERITEISTPMKRAQSPEDIGYAVAFLLSDAAINITGQSINVDGGRVMV